MESLNIHSYWLFVLKISSKLIALFSIDTNVVLTIKLRINEYIHQYISRNCKLNGRADVEETDDKFIVIGMK